MVYCFCLFVFCFSHATALFIAYTNYTTTGVLLGSGPRPLIMLHKMERSLTHIVTGTLGPRGKLYKKGWEAHLGLSSCTNPHLREQLRLAH